MSGSYANPFTWEQGKKGPFCHCWRFRFIPRPSPACAAQHKPALLTPEQRGQPDPEERGGQRRRRLPSAWTATIGERTWRRRGRWSDLLPGDGVGAAAFHNQPARGRWAAEAEADPDGDGDEAGAPPPTSSSLKRCGGRARSSAERGTVGRTPPPLRADGDDRGAPDAATTGAVVGPLVRRRRRRSGVSQPTARGRWAAEAEADPDGDGDEAGAPSPPSSSSQRCGGRARSSAERGTEGRTPPLLRADGDDRGGPDAATTGAVVGPIARRRRRRSSISRPASAQAGGRRRRRRRRTPTGTGPAPQRRRRRRRGGTTEEMRRDGAPPPD